MKKLIFNTLISIPPVPFILRMSNPNYSYCQKCGLPWNHCESKSVPTSENTATFATCDICWDNSSLYELKIYYIRCYVKQQRSLIGSGYEMEHTMNDLLKNVEKEYLRIKNEKTTNTIRS